MHRLSLAAIFLALAIGGCVRTRAPQRANTVPVRDVTLVVDAQIVGIPPDAKELRLWIPVPRDDGAQVLSRVIPDVPVPSAIVTDSSGNPALLVVVPSPASSASARVTFEVSRAEQRGSGAAHPFSHVEKQAPRVRCGFLLPPDEKEGTLAEPDCWDDLPDSSLDGNRIGVSSGETVLPFAEIDGRPIVVLTRVSFRDR